MIFLLDFYKGKRIFVTGHTGFKGTWLCKMLIDAGAQVTGYALKPENSFFAISNIEKYMNSVIGDIRDLDFLEKTFNSCKPEIAIHLAAQPLVRFSYTNPAYTYETNVIGTVNFLECIRASSSVRSVLNVTTDKVYQNNEWEWGYREDDKLDGYDPYSNSKSCSELVTFCYKRSFFRNKELAVSTVRAGNVIGGGDFSKDRIIPDCIRAVEQSQDIVVRNPHSVRPYQHVLDALNAYLLIMERQFHSVEYAGHYNVGPMDSDCVTTGDLVELFCRKWGGDIRWSTAANSGPHESNFLRLDCSRIRRSFGWEPRWNIEKAIEKTVEWTRAYINGESVQTVMKTQIKEFFGILTVNN